MDGGSDSDHVSDGIWDEFKDNLEGVRVVEDDGEPSLGGILRYEFSKNGNCKQEEEGCFECSSF